MLKAVSLLDPELGYCQGLGFIAGILLLHVRNALCGSPPRPGGYRRPPPHPTSGGVWDRQLIFGIVPDLKFKAELLPINAKHRKALNVRVPF